MATLLDGILESHEGPEPRVVTSDVQAVLRRVIRPGEDDGEAVATVADNAGVSTRTVYRVLNPDESKETISLDLADRLCIACGTHIAFSCRLWWPQNGAITPYVRETVTAPDNLG